MKCIDCGKLIKDSYANRCESCFNYMCDEYIFNTATYGGTCYIP